MTFLTINDLKFCNIYCREKSGLNVKWQKLWSYQLQSAKAVTKELLELIIDPQFWVLIMSKKGKFPKGLVSKSEQTYYNFLFLDIIKSSFQVNTDQVFFSKKLTFSRALLLFQKTVILHKQNCSSSKRKYVQLYIE